MHQVCMYFFYIYTKGRFFFQSKTLFGLANHPLSSINLAWFIERNILSWVTDSRTSFVKIYTWIKIAIVTWQWTHQPRPWRLEPNSSPWKTSVAWHGTDKFNTSSPQLSPRDASSGISAKTTQSSKSVTLAPGIPGIWPFWYFQNYEVPSTVGSDSINQYTIKDLAQKCR